MLDVDATDFGSLPSLECSMTNDANLIDGNEMHLLACSVYHSLLKHLPALVTLRISFFFLFVTKVATINWLNIKCSTFLLMIILI